MDKIFKCEKIKTQALNKTMRELHYNVGLEKCSYYSKSKRTINKCQTMKRKKSFHVKDAKSKREKSQVGKILTAWL